MAMRHALRRGTTEGRDGREAALPLQVVDGATLGEVRFWDEAGWAAIPVAERPRECAHKPGVGWVAMVPVACMN